jgi:uncharacterized repeat protein (TIGR03803 family)
MNIKIHSALVVTTLAALLPHGTTAQTFTSLYDFTNTVSTRDPNPVAGLIVSGSLLYGVTSFGGANGNGMVFSINTNGTGFAALHPFNTLGFVSGIGLTNSDGSGPIGLVLSGNMLYGSATSGGTNGAGTVFALNTNGSGFVTLHTFNRAAFDPNIGSSTNSDGENPEGGMILSGGTLYGTTYQGGTNGWGTVFALSTNGTGFTTLHSFSGGAGAGMAAGDGANPQAALILNGATLYGTTQNGGTNGWGTVFGLNTNGTGYITLHNFTPYTYDAMTATLHTNTDGANPEAALILNGATLYGTTQNGGTNGNGMVFAVSTDGTTSLALYDFSATNVNFANSDGAAPQSALVMSGNTLYGTAEFGGTNGNGTVFALNTNGTGFTTLYNFNPFVSSFTAFGYTNYGGANPKAGLVLSGNTLFGTAYGGASTAFGNGGGADGDGTVFALTISLGINPIPLNLQLNGQNAVLTWGNPAFYLQTAAGITGPWTVVAGATSPYDAARTNRMQFFRLVYTNSP